MHEEIIEKLIASLNDKIINPAYPKFPGAGYKSRKIDAKNFNRISKSNLGRRIAFVDGGNAEILGSANFSLSLIRAGCAVYLNNKKISFKKYEFFAFTHAVNKDGEICYAASYFAIKNDIGLRETSFSSFDRTLMLGTNRAEIGTVANAVRRFAELRMAKLISDEKSADIILLDGSLQSALTNENNYLNELYESCGKNDVILSALSKTSSLFADNGNLVSVLLNSISPPSSWYYYPIAEINSINHKAEMYFVKLHGKSRHAFRFEIFNAQKDKAEEVIGILAGNSADPIFIGYPYGLIEADKIARVSNQEKESLKTMFFVKLKNKNIEKYMSINAHEILDRISF